MRRRDFITFFGSAGAACRQGGADRRADGFRRANEASRVCSLMSFDWGASDLSWGAVFGPSMTRTGSSFQTLKKLVKCWMTLSGTSSWI
jgi:hypothetical protein